MRVELPIDHLAEVWPAKLRGARLGALLHPASVSANLIYTSKILEGENGKLFQLAAFFGPQHGFLGQTQDNMIEWKSYEHPRLGIPVHSLYGEHREPTPAMLDGLDVLLVDLQDVGARYYTFIWTMFLAMRACEKAGVHVVVLDRPNPINGLTTEGPILDREYFSFIGLHPIHVRHGRTIGELAQQFREEAFSKCELSILPMKNWKREMWFDETGLPWVNAVSEHADARHGHCLSRPVFARRHKHFRRAGDNATVRKFRRTVHRCRSLGSRIESSRSCRRLFS
ncbi:MAG TPA: DUF1343 domain-containing protein [Chthoniobacterales bacterium]